jgi:nucleotide-binding universal stress UspA family protein
MSIKDILVHVDESDRGALRTEIAIDLAARHEAHLTGLGISAMTMIPSFVDAELPPSIIEERLAGLRETVAAAEAAFSGKARLAGISSEWRVIEMPVGDVARVVSDQARHVDLTIVGQPDPEASGRTVSLDLVERLILDAGGPVLLIPYVGKVETLATHTFLAWNGSRESARSADDVLPLLAKGARVTVMHVNPPGKDHAQRDIAGVDIATYLARHDLDVKAAHVVAEDMKVGGMILSRAVDFGADLIVMGAYGRSRFREMILGGATRHILRHMIMPVLMSH